MREHAAAAQGPAEAPRGVEGVVGKQTLATGAEGASGGRAGGGGRGLAPYAASVKQAFAAGGGAPIQARLTPKGEELAAAWQREVLGASTLPYDQVFQQGTQLIQALRVNDLSPEAGDMALLGLIQNFQLQRPDPHAIFDDVVPGVVAMQRIGGAHQRLLGQLDQHIKFGAIDEYVERELQRTAQVLNQGEEQGQSIRAVRGGSLTSMKDPSGDLSPSLNSEGRGQKLELAQSFNNFTAGRAQPQAPKGILLYRRVKGEHLKALRNGASFDEILPFSASWSRQFAVDWAPGEGVVFEIDVPMSYPMLFQARRPGAQVPEGGPQPLNQEQGEVTLVQSRLTLTQDPRQEGPNMIARASAAPLTMDIAERQHDAMNVMPDEHRMFVNAQQRDEDPQELSDQQEQIAHGLAQLGGARGTLMTLAQNASTPQLQAVGQVVFGFADKHKPDLGPVTSVLLAFGQLRAGDQPLLQMLLRRVFDPQYYSGTSEKFTPDRVIGLVRVLLPAMAKALGGVVQLKVSGGGGSATPDAPAPTGGGNALPTELRAHMEKAFSTDFTDVRVHEGAHVSALGAHAYAQGSALHFAPGQYAPDSAEGRELIGHELAHVVQQRTGRVGSGDGGVNRDGSLEAEADAAGARAARGDVTGLAGGEARSTSGGPKQRKLTAEGEPATAIRDLLLAHSARNADLEKIRDNDNIDFVFMPATDPPGQFRGVSGWTRAKLRNAEGELIATVGNGAEARGLSKAILGKLAKLEVEIWGFTLETSEATGGVVAASPTGQTLTMIHEFERHALPFYDLYNDVVFGQFNDDMEGGDTHVGAIATDLAMERRGQAPLQHADPQLAANTVITTLSYAATLGAAQKAEALFRLWMDTVHRGVAFAQLRNRYTPGNTAIWQAFAALHGKMSTGHKGAAHEVVATGKHVIIIAGAFIGQEGVANNDDVPEEIRESPDEFMVTIGGAAVAYLPIDCWVLA
ncbi:MAG TPA: DUF4157 domain-containing protein [Kofleriaceae bacterium]|jgi:hypothetical protein